MPSLQFGRSDNGLASVTGVGTTQSGAPLLSGGVNVLNSTAANTAAILPTYASGPITVRVTGGTTATVFPPTGGSLNGGSANASVTVASGTAAIFVPHPNGLDYAVVKGA